MDAPLHPSRDKPAPPVAPRLAISPACGHAALRRGRWSSPDADYFLTICTDRRQQGLSSPPVAESIIAAAHQLTAEGHWRVRIAVVMPDHTQMLISLGESTVLSATIRLFKGRLSPVLRAANLRWERGYFDHRMRPEEDRLPVFLYIFLNPYRASLLAASENWPAFYCAPEDWTWFHPLTNSAMPCPTWLL